jgi:ribosomal protein S18 acetylase RimI-like enzyme
MDKIVYTSDVTSIAAEQLTGFFVGWPNPPSSETLLRLLQASALKVLAINQPKNQVVGYITALTDGVLFGYISSLEVLPIHQKRGIGQHLVQRILEDMSDLYAIDLVCDPEVQLFYERFGLKHCSAMIARRYDKLFP